MCLHPNLGVRAGGLLFLSLVVELSAGGARWLLSGRWFVGGGLTRRRALIPALGLARRSYGGSLQPPLFRYYQSAEYNLKNMRKSANYNLDSFFASGWTARG